MKNTLWTFGDSYTAEYSPVDSPDIRSNYDDYKEWRGGNLPDIWPKLLSEKLNLNYENRGIGGSSNYSIFNEFIKEIDNFVDNDIVIIGWASLLRFWWADDDGLQNALPSFVSHDVELIDKSIVGQIIINRDNIYWTDEVWNWIKLINRFCQLKKVKIFYWSSDINLFLNKNISDTDLENFIKINNDHKSLWNYINNYENYKKNPYPQIFLETSWKINDGHLGEFGHKFQTEVFYNYLRDKI